jgi:hypothetical protein
MDKTHVRIVNGGAPEFITNRQALDEINAGQMAPTKKNVRTMSCYRSTATIEYRNGDTVQIRPATDADKPAETTANGNRIVTVKGKRYVVSPITPARPRVDGCATWVPEAYLSYWSERNGERYGATRHASGSNKPGTVGRAVWDEANR